MSLQLEKGVERPGRFQAVNAPYAALAKSSEKASAGFLHPSVCLGRVFN